MLLNHKLYHRYYLKYQVVQKYVQTYHFGKHISIQLIDFGLIPQHILRHNKDITIFEH